MTYTIDQVKPLVPEFRIIENEFNEPGEIFVGYGIHAFKVNSGSMADLLLTTRRQLEIAREALEYIYEVNAGDPVSQAKNALDTIKKEGELLTATQTQGKLNPAGS